MLASVYAASHCRIIYRPQCCHRRWPARACAPCEAQPAASKNSNAPPAPHPSRPPQDRRTLFNQWKAENGKKYATAAAENAAFAQFSAAVGDVVTHNSNAKNKFFKGERYTPFQLLVQGKVQSGCMCGLDAGAAAKPPSCCGGSRHHG